MDDSRSLWLLLPRPVRALPADLAATVLLVGATNVVVFAPVIRDTPLRVPVGLAFVLFVPGYAFVAALFPEAGGSPGSAAAGSEADGHEVDEGDFPGDGDAEPERGSAGGPPPEADGFLGTARSGIDGIERVALAFGLSIAVVPLIGLVLNFTPWGIRLVPIVLAVSGFTLAATAVAAYRRWQLPPADRFRVPYRAWLGAGRSELFDPDTRVDAALNVLLVVSLLLATGSVVYAVAVPPQGEQFSELYILTEDDDELVAAGYPTEFVRGERSELVVGVGNNEHRTAEYTVVVVEQALEGTGNESTVTEQRPLNRFEVTLAHNETWQHTHEVAPTIAGNDTRLVWLLYVDEDPPTNPDADTAPYSVHLWVDVAADSEDGG